MGSLPKLSRRGFLGALGAGAATAGCADRESSKLNDLLFIGDSTKEINSEVSPTNDVVTDESSVPTIPVDLKRLLLNRTTYGPTAADSALYDQLGPAGFLEYQLNPSQIDDSACTAAIAPLWALAANEVELLEVLTTIPMAQLTKGAFVRPILSKRQLFERMVEFWLDHFNVSNANGINQVNTIFYDRDIIRQHALGNFRELLQATAKSAAMMFFLGNGLSVVDGINENYARELMELHTIGINGGYIQADIPELARVLTGWGWGAFGHHFAYYQNRHDILAKNVLGVHFPPSGGIEEGEKIISYLANHPGTAHFIATKLVHRFICNDPPQAAISAVAQTFLATEGDIKSTLRTLFSREVLEYATPKFKRPMHLLAGMLRQTAATVDAEQDVTEPLRRLGHEPYQWQDPDGYPDKLFHWAPGILERWNAMSRLISNEVPGFTVPAYAIGTSHHPDLTSRMSYWSSRYFLGLQPQWERDAIFNYHASLAPSLQNDDRELLALTLSMPSYQVF